MFTAIVKALWAAWTVWKQEREIANKPELVKAKAAQSIQDAEDKIERAKAILADPRASQKDHEEALRTVRLAH